MAQPEPYDRQNNFTAALSGTGNGTLGADLDREFDEARQTIEQTRENLEALQRDDLQLANESVGLDQLKPELLTTLFALSGQASPEEVLVTQVTTLSALKALPVTVVRAQYDGNIWEAQATSGWSATARSLGEGYMLAASTVDASKTWVRRVHPQLSHFGVVHNPTANAGTGTNVTTLLQRFLDYCVETQSDVLQIGMMAVRTNAAVTYDPTTYAAIAKQPAFDLSGLTIFSSSTAGGIVIGSPERAYRPVKMYSPGTVRFQINWSGANGPRGNDSGCTIYNMFYCKDARLGRCYGWTNGVVLHGENFGFAYNRFFGSDEITDCQSLLVLRTKNGTVNPGAEFCNENSFYGMVLRYNSDSDNVPGTADVSGYAIRYVWDGVNSYQGHNANRFYGTTWELGAPAGATYRVPIYFDGCAGINIHTDGRAETWKGPLMLCRGDGTAFAAFRNEASFDYCEGGAASRIAVLEVNGAYGNRIRRVLHVGDLDVSWVSGPLRNVVRSNGASDSFRLAAPFYSNASGSSAPVATVSGGQQFVANADALQLRTSSLGIVWLRFPVHTSHGGEARINTGLINRPGRLAFRALDANGAVLSGNATDATWGNEPYIKFFGSADGAAFGGGLRTTTADSFATVRLSWRSEVKFLEVGVTGGTADAAIRAIEMVFFCQYQDIATGALNYIQAVAPVYPLLGDAGNMMATANPFSAGSIGSYVQGQYVQNAALVAGQPKGWHCTTTGDRARNWAGSTAYSVLGQLVANGGNIYRLRTGGTSASSGGPTGTTPGAVITDGTCEWTYYSAAAAGTADANL